VPGDPTLLDQVSRPVGADHPGPSRDDGPTPVLDLVVPVYNEAHVLAASVRRLHDHLRTTMPYPWRITIADNASTDGTAEVARQVGLELDRIRVIQLDRKGRSLALRTAWSASDATVLAYTDVDLSTDLDALLPLVAPLVSGHSDVAIGSRLARGASVAAGIQHDPAGAVRRPVHRRAVRVQGDPS
jgi:glycosyltransferase involved in cell wall biosynthesis